MKLPLQSVLFTLLLLPSHYSLADEMRFSLAGSAGKASISNFAAFADSKYFRLSGSIEVNQMLSLNLFDSRYSGFKYSGTNPTEIKLDGRGVGVTGSWPLHPHLHPYLRLEYMKWTLSSYGFGKTLATESGGSAGFAAGLRIPINDAGALIAEVSGYDKVSDANIRQYSLGLAYSF